MESKKISMKTNPKAEQATVRSVDTENEKRPTAAEIWRKAEEYGVCGVSYAALKTSWKGALGLFNHKKAAETLEALSKHANNRLALAVVLLSGLVIFGLMVLTTFMMIEATNYQSDMIAEIVGSPQPKLDYNILPSIAVYYFLLFAVIGTFIFYAHEGIAYALAHVTGGKGTLAQHLYVSSVVWLAVSISMAAYLFLPFLCLAFATILSLLLVSLLYLMVYMYAKAYSVVHGISFLHALMVVLVLIAPTLALWWFVATALAAVLGIPTSIQVGA